MNDDHQIYLGDAVKALDDKGRIGGYLVRFGSPDEPDLQGDYFTKATDFGFDITDKARMMFHHGKDPTIGRARLGTLTMKADDVGIWAEGIIEKSDRYAKVIMGMVKAGKLRWSSSTADQVMQRTSMKGVNRIERMTKAR